LIFKHIHILIIYQLHGFDLTDKQISGLTLNNKFISGTVSNISEIIKDSTTLNISEYNQTSAITINYNFYPRPEITGAIISR
jgi:hypothetical protein